MFDSKTEKEKPTFENSMNSSIQRFNKNERAVRKWINLPEKRDLHQILGPPHGSRLHQVPPENTSPTESQHLRRHNHQQRHRQRHLFPVEHFNAGDEMDGVNASSSWISEDRDEHVLLHVELPRIQRELELPPFEEHSPRHRRRHQVAERDHSDLRRDGRHGERLPPETEELVEEREEKAS